jgi:hypothetical protein
LGLGANRKTGGGIYLDLVIARHSNAPGHDEEEETG